MYLQALCISRMVALNPPLLSTGIKRNPCQLVQVRGKTTPTCSSCHHWCGLILLWNQFGMPAANPAEPTCLVCTLQWNFTMLNLRFLQMTAKEFVISSGFVFFSAYIKEDEFYSSNCARTAFVFLQLPNPSLGSKIFWSFLSVKSPSIVCSHCKQLEFFHWLKK